MVATETSKRGKPEDCMQDLVYKWTSKQEGTGSLPRTWQTLVDAVKESGDRVLAEDLAREHAASLSH